MVVISIETMSKVYYRLIILFFWKMIQTHICEVSLKFIFDIVVKLLLLQILVNVLSTLIFPPHNGRAKRHSGNNFALLHWNAVKHVWNVFSEINETKDISLRCLLKFEDCFTYCMNNTAWFFRVVYSSLLGFLLIFQSMHQETRPMKLSW